MIEEIRPNLYRTEIPLPNNPLKWLNSYIIIGDNRFLIIDTGFNREECLRVMNSSLQKLGVKLNKTDFFITHLHADHMGLASKIAADNSKIYFNEVEAKWIHDYNASVQEYWEKNLALYTANGFALDDARSAMMSHPGRKYSSQRMINYSIIKEGDMIDIGDFHFLTIATPGHSPGHMCLFEAEKKILIAGDHVLLDITPNITSWLGMENSLEKYLASLEKISKLDVLLALPGHRRVIHDLRGRVKELQEHHRARLNEVLVALTQGEKDVYQIARHIKWDLIAKTWEEFPIQQKWFAFGEAMAHVRYLEDHGKVRRRKLNGTIKFTLT